MRCPTCDTLMLAEYPAPTVRVWRCLVCERAQDGIVADDLPTWARNKETMECYG